MNPGIRILPRLALVVLAAVTIAGCASQPQPAPVAPPPPAPEGPPPEAYGPPPPAPPTGPAPGTVQDFVINVGELVYFDFDKYDLRDDAKPVLAAQAMWLGRYPAVRVRIEGNCDERGTREYNFALGLRRANAVRDFLIGHGVAGERITTISYGKERPIDPGSDEQAWARNRNARTAITDGAR